MTRSTVGGAVPWILLPTLLVAGILLPGAMGPARAQVTAYGTAAKVNGIEISNQTLERNFQEYLRENNVNLGAIRNPDRVKAMRREVLDLLIDQELAWQAAQREKILATKAQVDEAVASMKAQFKSEQAFASRLAIEGYTGKSYREHIRRLVSAREYLDRVAARTPRVGDDEVHAFYSANPEKFTMTQGGTQGIAPEEAVREQVRAYLQEAKSREAVQAELKRLRAEANIEVLIPL